MTRDQASMRRGAVCLTLLVLLVLLEELAGCGVTSQASGRQAATIPAATAATAQPTPKPLAVTVKQLALTGYAVENAYATNTGFVFTAIGKDARGQQASFLYYHDLQTGATSLADTAAWDPNRCTGGCSGSNDTIWVESVAGDIVVYAHLGVGGAAGELRALQVGQWRQFSLDTSMAYAAGGEALPVRTATDGQHVAWERSTGDASGLGASSIHVFDTSAGAESVSFPTDANYYYDLGFAGGNLIYAKLSDNAARGDQTPIFSQPLTGAPASQLATENLPTNPVGDESYVAWDQIYSEGSGTTSVLSLPAMSQQSKTYPCIGPDLAGHFMACAVFGSSLQLWDLSTGSSDSFASPAANFVTVSSGQMVWWDGTMVNIVPLPQ